MSTYTIDIRNRRQVTFPSELLKLMDLEVGDSIEVKVQNKLAVMKPKKQIALDAFKELQKAFQESGVSEKEIASEIDKQRLADARRFYHTQNIKYSKE